MSTQPEGTDQEAALVAVDLEPVVGGGLVPVNLGVLQATTPTEMMAVAASIATPLKQFILDKGLYKDLGGDTPHVYVEAWCTMLAMLGVMPQEISVEEVPLVDYPGCGGWGPKYVAKMALVRITDQQVVCSASAECGGPDERDWHWRPKYKWEDGEPRGDGTPTRTRIPDGERAVAGSQRRSMAITRATGKAARVGFAWVMTLAGYSGTPLEEFGAEDKSAVQDPAAPTDTPPPKQDKGRDPREMMGDRSSYRPGQTNKARQNDTTRQDQPKAGGAKLMNSNYGFVCVLCNKGGEQGDPIAYERRQGKPYVAHADCHHAQEG